jgi:hypothetical protein
MDSDPETSTVAYLVIAFLITLLVIGWASRK